jgi:hypothetical protein
MEGPVYLISGRRKNPIGVPIVGVPHSTGHSSTHATANCISWTLEANEKSIGKSHCWVSIRRPKRKIESSSLIRLVGSYYTVWEKRID